MVVKGKEIYIQADWSGLGDWYTLAGSKSCQIKGDCEEIEIASPDTGEWYTALAGRKKLTINFSYLLLGDGVIYDSDSADIKDVIRLGNIYKIQIRESGTELEFNAMLKSIDIVATNGNLAQGSIQFVSVGEVIWR
jgi:predicted secreted protein